MRKLFNVDDWVRKDHFNFFSRFEEPFFGVNVTIDCTTAYHYSKANNVGFFAYYLYNCLKAANSVQEFKLRIVDSDVYLYDQVDASAVINRPDQSFGFSYINYHPDLSTFQKIAAQEIARVKNASGLVPAGSGDNVLHISAMPWLDFTSLSHARSFAFKDSCPKISFGKMTTNENKLTMPVSIHVNHALMDGYHVSLFVEEFQRLMNEG